MLSLGHEVPNRTQIKWMLVSIICAKVELFELSIYQSVYLSYKTRIASMSSSEQESRTVWKAKELVLH